MPGLIRRLLPGLMALIFMSLAGTPHAVAQTAGGTSVEQAQPEERGEEARVHPQRPVQVPRQAG